jgi:hypothetical protein
MTSNHAGRPDETSTGERQDSASSDVPETPSAGMPGQTLNDLSADSDPDDVSMYCETDESAIPTAGRKELGLQAVIDLERLWDDPLGDAPCSGPSELLGPRTVPARDGLSVADSERRTGDVPNHADDRRRELVALYMAEAMEHDDPLVANVGVINADLMQIAATFTKCLAPPLAAARCPEAIGEVLPTVTQYLKVVKQLDRLTNLTLRLKATEWASVEIRQPLDGSATSQDREP